MLREHCDPTRMRPLLWPRRAFKTPGRCTSSRRASCAAARRAGEATGHRPSGARHVPRGNVLCLRLRRPTGEYLFDRVTRFEILDGIRKRPITTPAPPPPPPRTRAYTKQTPRQPRGCVTRNGPPDQLPARAMTARRGRSRRGRAAQHACFPSCYLGGAHLARPTLLGSLLESQGWLRFAGQTR